MSNSTFYNQMADTALRLIEQFGQKLHGARYKVDDSDYTTGEISESVDIEGDFDGVILPADKGFAGQFNDSFEVLSEVFVKVRYLILSAKTSPFVPAAGDLFDFDDKSWIVLGNTPINPAGIPLVYKVGVKQN